MCVLRNEAARLPIFLEHYKKLGVDRFFMVDNDSSDGSADILLAEPLADIFHTAVSFRESCFGLYWYNGLAREYCVGNWLLMADADELLVYDGMEQHGLRDLAQWLAGQGFDRLFSLMLDVYPSGSIGRGARMIAEILGRDCWFDAEGYSVRRGPTGWTVTGGARHRLFEAGGRKPASLASKYPFFRVSDETSICNSHYLWPFDTTTNIAFGTFLHLKFMDDFVERSVVNEREGQHWKDSLHYREMNRRVAATPEIVAVNGRSQRYTGPQSLVSHHIMSAIDWTGKESPDHARPYLAIGRIAWGLWQGAMPPYGREWPQHEEFKALSRRSLSEHLTTIRCRGALAVGEVGLICVLRNEIDRLPLFFEHYRGLGVTRFLIVDNGSDDGSHEFLLAAPDADIFHTDVPFSEAHGGLFWANGIAAAYCVGRWIVRADADELLVYDGMEEHDLRQLARWLEESGQDRLFAPLLDVYPSDALGQPRRGMADILRLDCWFDSSGYALAHTRGGWQLTGGARKRLFAGEHRPENWPALSKYPFFRMSGETIAFCPHWLWPYDETTEGPQGTLIHLKLMDDLASRAAKFVREGQHHGKSEDYRLINDVLGATPDLVAFDQGSSRYRGPKSLVRQAFMLPIDWQNPAPPGQAEERKKQLRPRPPERTMWIRTFPKQGGHWERRDEFNLASHSTLSTQMDFIRCRGPLAPGEVGVVCIIRNEADRLPLFFEHYKTLGATRFFMVDNGSGDESLEILLAEPLADVFLAHASYVDGLGGIYWANGIAREFCRDCWIVRADADELLVYDGMERKDLRQLGKLLEQKKRDRLFALMIDLYPSGEIGRQARSIAAILGSDCWFDSDGYAEERMRAGWLTTGGARDRLFSRGPDVHQHWLSKYPFVRMVPDLSIVDAHFLWPVEHEKPEPLGALLHLKLMDDLRERSLRFAGEGQHSTNSLAYRLINERLAQQPELVARHSGSRPYEDPQSLIRHGMMLPIDWQAGQGPTGLETY